MANRKIKDLSYLEIMARDDFKELLTKAVENRECIKCGEFTAESRNGLCWECYEYLDEKERIYATCLDQHQVKVKAVLPDKFPWEQR